MEQTTWDIYTQTASATGSYAMQVTEPSGASHWMLSYSNLPYSLCPISLGYSFFGQLERAQDVNTGLNRWYPKEGTYSAHFKYETGGGNDIVPDDYLAIGKFARGFDNYYFTNTGQVPVPDKLSEAFP